MSAPACAVSLEAVDITRVYRRGAEEIRAVDGVSLTIGNGEFVSIIGPSGSGKTTLVNVLGCLDNPTSGRLVLNGRVVFDGGRTLSEKELTIVRRELFGYVFQKFYLVPTLTVAENVALPFTFYRKPGANGNGVGRALELMGIAARRDHLPGQLSGGEMQRAAIARALVNRPCILLADEPTGNLDTKRSEEIGAIFRELNAKERLTIVLVTHNPSLAAQASRTIEIRDGRVVPLP